MFLLNFCKDTWDIWQMVGKFIRVFRIILPLLLIVFASIDLGKAVVSSDEKVIKQSTRHIAVRCIVAIIIFFIPMFISAVFNLIDDFHKDVDSEGYNLCYTCITKPNSDNCIHQIDTKKNK